VLAPQRAVAYLAMRGWLNHFAYQTRIGVLVFLSAALVLGTSSLKNGPDII